MARNNPVGSLFQSSSGFYPSYFLRWLEEILNYGDNLLIQLLFLKSQNKHQIIISWINETFIMRKPKPFHTKRVIKL